IPALHGGMRTSCLCESTGNEAFDGRAIMCPKDPGAADFLAKAGVKGEGIAGQLPQSGGDPLISYIETNNQPQPGHTRIGKQEPGNRRLWNLSHFFWSNDFRNLHDVFFLSDGMMYLICTAKLFRCGCLPFHPSLLG